jgi:hypothetical protein
MLTNQMLFYGLWETEGDVDHHLAEISTDTERKAAIKIQLNFRKSVLGQKYPDMSIFHFSKRGASGKSEKFTTAILIHNLKLLVEKDLEGPICWRP